ncbi:hypothetical protein DGo_CA1152 [Deinococcus gobiensis I-0]|uniref:Uncharacterized protein n=1 Tax=Deinococcus gobiensis (strain DSM 21396 / JCM 16679 / CGMCC 1.7299 / I-0) TaxID=745776 RepID=H8GRN2_DEIGI|nr:hypothetical protein DGo_CA1152 [Deinococcus gobiensis I-0]
MPLTPPVRTPIPNVHWAASEVGPPVFLPPHLPRLTVC